MPSTKIIVTERNQKYHLQVGQEPDIKATGKSFYESLGLLFNACKEIFTQREVTVTPRSKDHHACIKGDPGRWGAGKNEHAAVGNLINAHQKNFGIYIEWK